MSRTARTLALMAFTALVGCSQVTSPPTVEPVILRLYSTPESAPLVTILTQGYRETHPGVQFERLSGSHEVMIQRLAQQPESYLITYHVPANRNLWAAPLARDGLVLVVHPANPVSSLTPDDVRRVYQGFVNNWQTLGGANLPVQVISLEQGSGVRAEFERLVMGQRQIAPETEIVPSPEAALLRVAELPGAVAYGPYSQVSASVKTLAISGLTPTADTIANSTYPLRMMIFIMGQTTPQGAYGEFLAWIQSDEGQRRLSPGYAPLP